MTISDEKYVSFTTYRKNGEPKPLPIWIVDLGDGEHLAAFGIDGAFRADELAGP